MDCPRPTRYGTIILSVRNRGDNMRKTKWKEKRGLTLLEMLTVIAILAVVSAIAIPSVLGIRNALLFREKNDHARTIFLAAQARLTQLRSSGALEDLPQGAPALRQAGDGEHTPPEGYVYLSSENGGDFDKLLPVGLLEQELLEQQILIEYHPESGNVFAVFYYDGEENLTAAYVNGSLSREENFRRDKLLGYYDGSDLAQGELSGFCVKLELDYADGQAGILTVRVPAQTMVNGLPVNFMGNDFDAYMRGLEITLTITGQRGGTVEKIIKPRGTAQGCSIGAASGGVQAVCVSVTLDALTEGSHFSDLGSICPGDNVTITAAATFQPGSGKPSVFLESAVLPGVNPMFASLTEGRDGLILAISNGRHLQNLNLVAPEIARDVETVLFTAHGESGEGKHRGGDIDWAATARYYGLSSFQPISNPDLFGAAKLTEEGLVVTGREKSVEIVGNGTIISNVHIHTQAPGFAGLFAYVNGKVDGLLLSNPVVRAQQADAVGALAGAAGEKARITNCGVYIDTQAADYSPERLDMQDFTGETGQYGVSGRGAVGGLIGYATTDLRRGANISTCFAAVPVYGNLSGASGNRAGAGGLVGYGEGGRFKNCYASGFVAAVGCVGENTPAWENNYLGLTEAASETMGAGGFVGTGHGCRFENCFATGNVTGDAASVGGFIGVMGYDTRSGDRKTKFLRCYALGDAKFENLHGSFSGVNAVFGEAPQGAPGTSAQGILYQNCYYLSKYLPDTEIQGYASTYCAQSAAYDALQLNAESKVAGFASGWATATNARTHAYDNREGAYPFFLQEGMVYYGLWPEQTIKAGIAYWETYGDSGKTGYYFDRDSTSTLRQDAIVIRDGYAVLSSCEQISVVIDGTAIPVTRQRKPLILGQDAYHVFILPELETPEDFYAEVTVTAGTEVFTLYYSPNAALTQIHGEKPGGIPAEIRIRSPRQLAALGEATSSYVQELNLDFAAAGVRHVPIQSFAGSYDGDNHWISGAEASIFATVEAKGTVVNLHLESGSGLALSNYGTIAGSTASGTLSGPLVAVNGGTITDCTVDAQLENETGEATGLLVGKMTGGAITKCTVSGSVTTNADFIGGVVGCLESGLISRVTSTAAVSGAGDAIGTFVGAARGGTIRDCHTTGENGNLHFVGAAAETSSQPVSGEATHFARSACTQTTCSAEETGNFTTLEGAAHTKPTYKTVFENCTFRIREEQRPVLCKTYYYRLVPMGGRKAVPETQTGIPESGTYLFLTTEGTVLCVTEGGSIVLMVYGEGMPITEGMLWQPEGSQWVSCLQPSVRMEKTENGEDGQQILTMTESVYTVTAELTSLSMDAEAGVEVAYRVSVRVTETVTAGQAQPVTNQTTTVQEQGAVVCDLYRVTDNTDCTVIYVDERYGLTILD